MVDPDLISNAKDLVPAAQQFGEAIGRTSTAAELGQWISDIVRYRRIPHQARLLEQAAIKIRATGIPASAVDDRLLRAVLEDGGFEEDARMQDRWSSLLANAATGLLVPPAFPEILRQLEPVEAVLIDELTRAREPLLHGQMTHLSHLENVEGLLWRHLDNLERLQVANWSWLGPVNVPLPDKPSDSGLDLELHETELGRAFVAACANPTEREPRH